ncbi:MAG: O-antigen ligase family protein, partial [Actinomycetota bacterium]
MKDWILDSYHSYARSLLLAALFLTPVVFYRGSTDVFNLVKLTVLWTLGIAAVALWIIWSAERGVWLPRFRLLIPAAAFLLAMTVATVISISPATSLLGMYQRYGGLLPYLLYALVMVAVVGLWWEKPNETQAIAKAVGAAAGVVSTYALIQAAGLDWLDWREATGRKGVFSIATLGNSNFAGGYLAVALPYLTFLIVSGRSAYRLLWGVVGASSLAALWFTQTRAGMIGAAAGLAVMALVLRRHIPGWLKALVASAVVAGGLLVVLVLLHPEPERLGGPLGEDRVFRTDTFEVRRWYWIAALRALEDRPLLGSGPDTYYAVYPPNRLREDGGSLGLSLT